MDTRIIDWKRELGDIEWQILNSEMDRKRKSPVLVYLLWLFLSPFGVHKFYLGRPWQGILYLVFPSVAGFAFLFGVLGFFGGVAGVSHVPASHVDSGVGFIAAAGISSVVGLVGLFCFFVWWVWDLLTLHRQTERANERIEIGVLRELALSRGEGRVGTA